MAKCHSREKLDLAGQRFGKLTVLAPADNIGTRTAWRCRCDCGRDIVVSTRDLRRSRRTSCGCDRPIVDPSPGGYGRASLTYVDGTCVELIRAGTVRRNNTSGVPGVDWMEKKRRWRASICFKGRRRYLGSFENLEDAVRARKRAEKELFDPFLAACSGEIPYSELRDIEEVCPPIARDYSQQRLDLTGQRFGMLTVLAPAENIGSMTAWRCRCDCGKETVVMTGHLRDGHTTSCGCKPSVTLIDGTCVELIQSKTIRRNNTSGVTGVTWNNQQNRWDATLMFKGKRHYLGGYSRFEDAVKARKRAEEELFEPFLEEFSQSAQEEAKG